MTKPDYADRYRHIKFDRQDGILQMTLHSEGGVMRWGGGPHEELGRVFREVGGDRENKVIILTGTADAFIEPVDTTTVAGRLPAATMTPQTWDKISGNARHLIMDLLDIEVPMIAAVNGAAVVHAEIAVLCDIVIAADHAVFQDAPHFPNGLVPGDGVHVVWPLILGPNRGRYFLLTGQKLSAKEALDLGVVSEVMPLDQLQARAWALARQLADRPLLTLRYSRAVLTQQLKRLMLDHLGPGLALQGLAANDYWPAPPR